MSTGAPRIGHLSTFYHTALLLMARGEPARSLPSGIEWKLFPTGPAIVEAFERQELDLAYIGLPPAIIGMERGVPVKCIAGGHTEGTIMAGRRGSLKYPEAGSLSELMGQFRGKRIGVPGSGSIHDVILSYLLKKYGLAGDLEVINFRWADDITEAMASGGIDAAFGTPALAVALMRYAGGQLLCPAGMLWPNNPSYGIVAHTGFLKEKSGLVERFLSVHEEADEMLRTRPGEAAEIISGYVGIVDSDFVLDTLRISQRYCAQLSESYISSTMEFVAAMKDLGYLHRELRESEIFDATYIRKVHPPGDHYGDGIL